MVSKDFSNYLFNSFLFEKTLKLFILLRYVVFLTFIHDMNLKMLYVYYYYNV